MTHRAPAPVIDIAAYPSLLEPDAIGLAQDTTIGLATVGPTVSVGLTVAALAATAAYAGPVILVLMAVPMLIIANAYRRLNLWQANCGASFEWVGRAINPYLGFLTGWLMAAGTLVGTLSPVVVLGPSILAITGTRPGTWADAAIATAVVAVMLILAVAGIKLTARTQVAIGVTEYAILLALAIMGLAWVLTHHPGSFPITRAWFTPAGIARKGSISAGFLLAIFIYTGWDGTLYVNEEVRARRTNPGLAALLAVLLAALFFSLAQLGLQGVVSPARLHAHAAAELVYLGTVLAGSIGGRAAALALALSVIAATGAGLVLTARIIYGMASHRVLPPFLANVPRRFHTPAAATLLCGGILLALTWVYLLGSTLQAAFTNVIQITGLLYATFYMLTALAAITYHRRLILRRPWDALTLGLLPSSAIVFLGWVIVKSLQAAPTSQRWALAVVLATGLLLMLAARLILRSPFFHTQREAAAADPAH